MPQALADLPQIPASDVKTRGWRGVVRDVSASGPVVVTNHAKPEVVILSAEDYESLIAIVRQSEAQTEESLNTLRRQFDERLKVLQRDDAGDRLRAISRSPAALRGKVKAGAGF